ncbi:MAG: branched-chain amino acid ABC transporter permease [Thermodesulfobacteriota bacterium]|jgi:branched-chain amino acid transport system permease protein
METIWQGIFNGLVMGWIYVLVALGLTIVFSIMRIVQFAHGEIYMLGAYCTYWIAVVLGLNVFVALLLAALVMGLVGVILEKLLFRRFRGQIDGSIIVAIGLILLMQTIAAIGFGTQDKWIPTTIPGVLNIWNIKIPWERALSVITGIILVLVLFLFIRGTKMGQAMIATSQDIEAATLQGIDVNRVSMVSMAIGCALAAIAGGLMGAIFGVQPVMGSYAMEKGIAVIILGGLGSIWGAVIGGLLLGLIDGLIPLGSNTTVASIIGFSIIVLILIVKPQGFLGHE